jgi:hypothetical protein
LSLEARSVYKAAEGSLISKLLVNEPGLLVGEERHIESRKLTVFAVQPDSEQVRWRGAALPEPWWASIEQITHDTLYVQLYEESPLPLPSGILAVDLASGEVKWALPVLSFVGEDAGQLIAVRRTVIQEQYVCVDRDTGSVLGSVERSPVTMNRHSQLTFAHELNADQIASGRIERMLASIMDIQDLRGAIEQITSHDLTILTIHARETNSPQAMLENRLRQEMIIFDREEVVIFRDTLYGSTSSIVPGAYFLTNDLLIYVKEGSEIRTVSLGNS